jgi:carbamoyltransferase
MVVLGISPNHDSSLCVVRDGKILAAIARERFSRVKKDRFITNHMLNKLLWIAGVTIDDIDFVGITYWFQNRAEWKTELDDLQIFLPDHQAFVVGPEFVALGDHHLNKQQPYYHEGLGYELIEDLVFLNPPISPRSFDFCEVNVRVMGRVIPGYFVNHHVAHAASTFYTSNFEKSAIFTIDSTESNPYTSSYFGYGYKNRMETLYYPGVQVGHAYGMFTQLLGLGPGLQRAGVLMGLAAYGNVDPEVAKNIDDYTKSWWDRDDRGDDWRWVYRLFMKITGKVIYNPDPSTAKYTDENFVFDDFENFLSDGKEAQDVAATIQYIFEQTIFKFANKLYEDTDKINGGNLCLAGGSFLNCTTNGKIQRNTKFKNVSPYPGSGDDGLSVGCALYVSHHIKDVPRVQKSASDVVYLGGQYETPHGGQPLDLDFLSQEINDGKVVAWFQGRSEFGPRALGNRSFLANPKIPTMRDYINSEIKDREWFRPFAPAVCVENVNEYFDINGESPYMLKTCQVLVDYLPSVTHVDGSARVQTVRREDNPKFYDLLREFEKKSGVPILLNTSLNLRGEPIVETPEEAINLFYNSKTDILVINDSMWVK